MKVEFPGVSTASLGAMLEGYGLMAGVATAWPDARFWWTPTGAMATEVAELDDRDVAGARDEVCGCISVLAKWARDTGAAFEKVRRNRSKGIAAGEPPLKDPAAWTLLDSALAVDAEGAGVSVGRMHRPNPVLANWGQDGAGNLFTTLREAGEQAAQVDVAAAIFADGAHSGRRLTNPHIS